MLRVVGRPRRAGTASLFPIPDRARGSPRDRARASSTATGRLWPVRGQQHRRNGARGSDYVTRGWSHVTRGLPFRSFVIACAFWAERCESNAQEKVEYAECRKESLKPITDKNAEPANSALMEKRIPLSGEFFLFSQTFYPSRSDYVTRR